MNTEVKLLQSQLSLAKDLVTMLEDTLQVVQGDCEHEMIFIGQGLLTKEFRCNKCGLIKEE